MSQSPTSHEPTAEHIACMNDFKAVLVKHQHLRPEEMLALVSQLVGNLIAFQDQTRYTPATAIRVVDMNIQIGNAVAVETVFKNPEGSA